MSSSSEVQFEYRESKGERSPGPLEKLWQSTSGFGTMFLSGEEVERRVEEARSRGIQETETRLLAAHEREAASLRMQIGEALAAFERQREEYFQQIEKEVVRLALAIARQAIGREMKLNPALAIEATRDVLQRLEREGEVRIRVAAPDIDAWENALKNETANSSASLIPDPALPSGACTLETSVGTTHIDPVSEFDAIEEALMRVPHRDTPSAESTMVQ